MRYLLRAAIVLFFVGGLGAFFALQPAATVEVLLWTSGEKQNVIRPALERFNARRPTVTIGRTRYTVQARSVTVNSGEMYDHLVRRLAQGVEFPPATQGSPTIVSPSTSDWLAQVNHEVGRPVFDVANLKAIVRTPVVIFTYREMAECLGWPQRAVGWNDIVQLAENPQGWTSCPTARVTWGQKPLVAFTDPAVSSTARSTLQLLHAVGAGKSADQLSVGDVQDPKVRDFVRRFQATVDHYYPETLKLQTKMFQGPRFVHFAPVEEYTLPWLYQGRVNAESVPGGKVEQRPITDLGYQVVALYPKEGTVWHDNPFAIPEAPWVTSEQREAARVVGEYLWSDEVQREFVAWGFRPGTELPFRDVLTRRLGVDPDEPKALLGRTPAPVAQAIQRNWEDVKKPGVAVLVIDVSGSMAGAKLQQAKEGARRFLDSASPATHVGLVVFSSQVTVRVPIGPLPQTRFAIAEAIDRLQAAGGTALYEAVHRGVNLADTYTGVPGEAIRGVVLLSDGEANAGQVGLSDFIRVQDRQERDVRVGVQGGPALAGYLGAGFVSQPRNPTHIFSVGVGEADWEVLRIFAETSGGVVVRATESKGSSGLVEVLERFSKYF
ncbi:MAG: substrate-binding domain-containing protein [Chloroflexi bacterium]|nr:substrate-binding domain-containing protein [Chloroflexota bacterium]